MIILSVCRTCLQPYEITVSLKEIPLLKQITDERGETCPCPRLCGGDINILPDMDITQLLGATKLREKMPLTGTELYRAVKGLGLADEVPKSPELVHALLTGRKTVSVELETVGSQVFLHEIRLEGGVTLHLAAGARGSQVLKITRGNNHAG